MKIHPVILCGGSGTRLWPASRDSMPKQFIALFETLSTFQMTAKRVEDGALFARPVVISNADVRFIVAEQLKAVGIEADIVLEPVRRDSAAAVAVGALAALRRDPKAIVLVMAADHLVQDPAAFVESCREAAQAAAQGYIMTLGIRPGFAATGYGYIEPGARIGEGAACRVASFFEKPGSEAAQTYIDRGFLWNGGYFLFPARLMLEELDSFAPEVLSAAKKAFDGARTDLDFIRLDEPSFSAAPKISIDYAVMERTDKAGVLPVSFPWSDVGTWGAVWEALPHDENGNALRGNAEVLHATNCLVHSEGVLTTVVGLDDVVVVSTPDAVLVSSRQRSEAVKDLVASLKDKGLSEADEHLRMYRPWGSYQRIDIGTRFQVKRIVVHPGGRLSLQKHFHRAEHWIVVRGTAEVTVDDKIILLHENEAAYIPIGATHRLANPGRIPLELIEVQVGSYTGEDDIVRVEDVYGR